MRHGYIVYDFASLSNKYDIRVYNEGPWLYPFSAHKVWFDDAGNHPDSVAVGASINGSGAKNVLLNASNGWKHLWTGISNGYSCSVSEQVPAGYASLIAESRIAGVIANIPIEITIDDSGGYLLPSTGSVGTGGLLAAGTALLAGAVLALVSGVRKRRR